MTPTCGLANSGVDCPVVGAVGKCCGSACVNPLNDVNDCGQCGVQCPSNAICKAGFCQLPDAGSSNCSATSPNTCPAGTFCEFSKCVPLACPAGSTGETCQFGYGVGYNQYQHVTGTCCNGSCIDPIQDPLNCAGCGNRCDAGLCVAGSQFGGFGGSMCYAPASNNCQFGACQGDTFCAGGRCVPRTCNGFSQGGTCSFQGTAAGMCCPQGFSTTCVNPTNDANNCGGCGINCGGGTCIAGRCSNAVAACPAGHLGQFCNLDAGTSYVCCPGSAGCVNTLNDNANCGRCGGACGAGLTCVAGACLAQVCTASVQNQTCADDAGSFGSCCGTSCVHKGSDPNNCGTCGRQCVGNETCAGSSCAIDACDALAQNLVCHRDSGFGIDTGKCCSNACLDTRRDRNNCGACGRVCPGDAGCSGGNWKPSQMTGQSLFEST